MASENSGEGRLNVKRGRRRRSNSNEHGGVLPEFDNSMIVDDVEQSRTETQSNMETDISEQERDNELQPQHDTSDTLDVTTEQADEQTVDSCNTVTQTPGSTELQVDVEQGARSENITEESRDISMETDGDGQVEKSQTSSKPESVANGAPDSNANGSSVALSEDILSKNRPDCEKDGGDGVMEVQAIEISQTAKDQAPGDGENSTAPEQKQRKRRGRKPKPKQNDAPVKNGGQPTEEDFHAEIMKHLPKEGETKFSTEARAIIRLFLKRKKKIRCPIEGCDKLYPNVAGFEYHVLRCVGLSINVACDQCGAVYKSSMGLSWHLRTAHRPEDTQDEKSEGKPEETESIEEERSAYQFRRRSQRPRSDPGHEVKASADVPDNDANYSDSGSSSDDSEPIESKSIRSTTWMNYIEIIVESAEEEVVEEFGNMSAVSKALKIKGTLNCPKRCGRFFKTARRAYRHFKECTGKRKRFRCKLCDKILQSKSGIRFHVVTKHRKKEHNSENDEESEFSESEQAPQVPTPRKKFHKNIEYKKKTKDWYNAFLAETVLTCWRPSLKHWKKLPQSEAEHYLPVRKMSSVFRIESVNKKNWTPEQDKEYQLPLFSSTPINSVGGLCNVIFNVGGSVWAMDWVPTPVNEKNCDQYLAIGCHSDPDKNHVLSQCYEEKGVLQIWRVPKLQNEIRPTEEPEFCLGIVHDYGPLWDVQWCPSGAWDASFPQEVGELRRLGLLALACADGKVRIFSVPFPASLRESNDEETGTSPRNSLYLAVPHMVLSPGSLCRKYQNECGAAWAVQWQPIYGHKKVIASYADGTVAIWDLKTDNRILKSSSQDGLTELIFPISHFQAHNSVIRGLAWCPSEPNYIATGGYDRFIKVWDLRHTSQPVMQYEQVWNYHLTWPVHQGLLIFNTDMAARVKCTRIVSYFASSHGSKQISHLSSCFLNHNASGWDNDYSRWTNVVVSADAAGMISMNFLSELTSKRTAKRTQGIFRALIEPTVRSREPNEQAGEDESTGSNTQKDDFIIVFKDTRLSTSCAKYFKKSLQSSEPNADENEVFNETAYVQPHEATHTAFHKVRWNQNFSSYNWLAAAGKSGLVRLCCVDKLEQ